MTNSHTISPVDFYNEVATSYNTRQTASDRIIREKVSKLFMQQVTQGNVLDLGGGTGLDMPWLMQAGYHVYFLEPSVNMRLVAKQTRVYPENNERITFIEALTDFCQWTPENLPFCEKMNGVLLNFAVLNSIKDLHLFFEKIRMICNGGCYLIITMIDARPGTILKKHGLFHFAKQLIEGKSAFDVHFNDIAHKTFIYSLSYLRNCSHQYFTYVASQSHGLSGFIIVILSAK